MKVLVIAPQPFFQNRGTPIDVLLVLKVLVHRNDTKVDLLVYNEGTDIVLPNLNTHRTPSIKLTRNIRPGFSFKKLIADFFMFFIAWRLVHRNRYDLVHAGEESVFFAIFFKLLYGTPYVYDLDSSISQQLVETIPSLKKLTYILNWLEGLAIRKSLVNFPVCNALAELCVQNKSPKTVTLHDISQLKNPDAPQTGKLKRELGVEGLILLYCGNLEKYQGIELLLESFALAYRKICNLDLVIIGGFPEDLDFYKSMARKLEIYKKTHFLGPKPFEQLDEFLAEADILVAPRIRGINTPMKVFPYMHSGKPVLLTDLYTHNQILSNNEAFLAPCNPENFADGIIRLAGDENLRDQIGKNGHLFVERNHTFEAHRKRLNRAYDWIESRLMAS